MADFSVTFDRAAGLFRMAQGDWSLVDPIARLPQWLAFYRSLKARGDKGRDGRVWGDCYAGAVIALEAAAREAGNG